MNSELIVLENVDALVVFTEQDKMDTILNEFRQLEFEFVADVTTAKGRKEIASVAFRVAKAKTYLDGLGKDLVEDWKKKSKTIDAERKRVRETLDQIKDNIRKPLDAWEAAEAAKIENHKAYLAEIKAKGSAYEQDGAVRTCEELKRNGAWLMSVGIDAEDEFFNEIEKALGEAVASNKSALSAREKVEAEQAELARLRQEAEDRAKKDREDAIRREAEERVRREEIAKAEYARGQAEMERKAADRKANDERLAADRKAQEEKLAAERELERVKKEAEQQRLYAECKAREEMEAAERKSAMEKASLERQIKAEEDRKKREEAEKAKRESDRAYMLNKMKEAKESMMKECGLSEEVAKGVVLAIYNGKVLNVRLEI